MLSRAPSDVTWDALAPLLGQLETLQGVLDACALYLLWCAGSAANLAGLMLLVGLVLVALPDEGDGTGRFCFADENMQAK